MRHSNTWAYATVFSLGISWMSQQAKADMMGDMNLHHWRHGGAGGAWNGAFLGSSSCIHLGSWNEALTSRASLPVSSSGTVDNSAHHLGTSHFSASHHTHSADWDMGGSGNISSSSSSGILDDPCKKEATSAWSCGGSPKSESLPSDPILPEGRSASCRLAREADLMSPFPSPFLRPLTICMSPFNLFFQSHSSQQCFLMHFMHSG